MLCLRANPTDLLPSDDHGAAMGSQSGRPIMETLIADEPPSRAEGPDGIVSFHENFYTATIEGNFPDDYLLIFPCFFVNGTEYKLGPIDMLRVEKLRFFIC